MKPLILTLLLVLPCATQAQDILILGEVHDNPAHHRTQADKVGAFNPAALVFEMLTPEQADGDVLPQTTDPGALAMHLQWDHTGWPAFELYFPIFEMAPAARVYGAGLPRAEARKAMAEGAASMFGEQAGRFGLDQPLPEAEQTAREALQMEAHCNAMPEEMLPPMVEIQRLRDARLAHAALRAHVETGGPVAVITGNGHARRDWGVPSYLKRVDPGLEIHVIGQTEEEAPLSGGFDEILSASAVDRPDPCLAFQ